jgi:hypothetical protein
LVEFRFGPDLAGRTLRNENERWESLLNIWSNPEMGAELVLLVELFQVVGTSARTAVQP